MKDEKGTVLLLTLIFVLGFTMFGFASLYWSTVQNEATEKQEFSTQAFWLADGGIEEARSHLPADCISNPNLCQELTNQTLGGEGTYDIVHFSNYTECTNTWPNSPCESRQACAKGKCNATECQTECSTAGVSCICKSPLEKTWVATTRGTHNNQIRNIAAIFSHNKIDKALVTKDDLNVPCDPTGCMKNNNNGNLGGTSCVGRDFSGDTSFDRKNEGDCYYYEKMPDLSFSAIFNGKTIADLLSNPHDTFTNPDNKQIYSGLNVINQSQNNLTVDGDGFLVINVDVKKMSISTANFKGIIWINAGNNEVALSGNVEFRGSIFVDSTVPTKITGVGQYVYDPEAIEDALPPGGGFTTSIPMIATWNEF